MKEKATFLSYISAEKKMRKEQLKKNNSAKAGNQQLSEKSGSLENVNVAQALSN